MHHITLIVDRSGSMMQIRGDAEGGIKAFIQDHPDDLLLLYEFDDEFDRAFGPIKGSLAPDYELQPRGSTALYDAISRGYAETKELAGIADKVAIVVVTDGQENASRETTYENVQQIVKEIEATDNWDIIFLSSEPASAELMRHAGATTTGYRQDQTGLAYSSASAAVGKFFRGSSGKKIDMPDTLDDK